MVMQKPILNVLFDFKVVPIKIKFRFGPLCLDLGYHGVGVMAPQAGLNITARW